MGYLLVKYQSERDVFVDDEQCGKTNDPFETDDGKHKISLGPGDLYRPLMQKVVVQGEPYENPKTIQFVRLQEP